MQLKGKHIVLTGGTGGIGSALVTKLRAQGAVITIIGRHGDNLPVDVHFLQGDLSTAEGILDVAEALKTRRIDVLINLAGIQFFGRLEAEEETHIVQACHINLLAPILLSQAALPQMKQRKSGHIVQVGSTFGAIPFAYFATYSSTKAGLKGFSEALRREVSADNIHITHIAPRAVDTSMNGKEIRAFGAHTNMQMDPPEKIAMRIIQAIIRKEKDVYIGFPEKIFVRINAILPRIVDRALRKNNKLAASLFHSF